MPEATFNTLLQNAWTEPLVDRLVVKLRYRLGSQVSFTVMDEQDLWIFGYGSLIWRADFPWVEKRPARIRNWARKFWQGSTDHRGVPGSPGRVVTLIEAPGHDCWGIAYRIAPAEREMVMRQLDHREKGGYERLELSVHFDDNETVTGVTYHATPDNTNFLGDADTHAIARQIVRSIGPSGDNVEYVLRLEESLSELEAHDDHVMEIARRVRQLL